MTKSANSTKERRSCKICDKMIIGGSYKFKAHLFKHGVVKPRHTCEYCSKKFFRKDEFTRHIQKHKGIANVQRYFCDYCDRGFINKYNLISHLKRIHDDGVGSELGKFSCKVCDLYYHEARLLDNHIRKVHFNPALSKEPSHINKLINESWVERVVNKNACVRITKVNNNVIVIKQLKTYVRVKDEKVPPTDNSAQFDDQYSKAVCDYCHKEMIKKSLRLHIREVHMNIRKHRCNICKVGFTRHYQLVDHKCGQVRQRKDKNANGKKLKAKLKPKKYGI